MTSPNYKVDPRAKRGFRRADRRAAAGYCRACDRDPVDVSDDIAQAVHRIAERDHAAARRALPPRGVGRFLAARTATGAGFAFVFVSA